MDIKKLNFGFSKKFKYIPARHQGETGLVGLAMVAEYYGASCDVEQLRRSFPTAAKQFQLNDLFAVCQHLQLVARVVTPDVRQIHKVQTPCLVMLRQGEFLVIKNADQKQITIVTKDARSEAIPVSDFEHIYAGTIVELFPSWSFSAQRAPQLLKWSAVIGKIIGLKRSMIQIFALALAIEGLSLVSPLFIQFVTDYALLSGDRQLMVVLIIGFILVRLMQSAFEAAREWALMVLGATFNIQWISNSYKHVLQLPLSFFDRRPVGDVIGRLEVIQTIQRTLTSGFVEAILDGVLGFGTLIIMIVYSPALSVIGIVAACLYFLIRLACYSSMSISGINTITLHAKQQSTLMEAIKGMQTVKSSNTAANVLTRVMDQVYDEKNSGLKSERLRWITNLSKTFIFAVASILVVGLGAINVLNTNLSIGMLLALSAYNNQFASRVGNLIDRIFDFKLLGAQGRRLGELVLAQKEADLAGKLVDANPDGTALAIRRLQCRYGDSQPFIIEQANFVLKRGEMFLVSGTAGSGKSTLIRALVGIVPSAGEIKFGGLSCRQIGWDRFRNYVACVMHSDTLFSGSISENIAGFSPTPDLKRVIECAKLATVHDEIVSRPLKYHTMLGEGGIGLSASQQQRIMLARALYRKPKVILMDDALSFLSADEETSIVKELLSKGFSMLVVSSRGNLQSLAKRKFVIESRKLVEKNENDEVAATADPNVIHLAGRPPPVETAYVINGSGIKKKLATES